MDFAPLCDCYSFSCAPVTPNVGILASRDIVSIDQAAADLVNSSKYFMMQKKKAEDNISSLSDANWQRQLEYAESLGLGERDYQLVKIK